MREKIARFMYGRYGTDGLGKLNLILALVFVLLSSFRMGDGAVNIIFWIIGYALLVISILRMMSRKHEKRRAENERYLAATAGVRRELSTAKERFAQRKEYKFFKCPSCGTVLRVPRGKGRIRIICRKCGASFEKKT